MGAQVWRSYLAACPMFEVVQLGGGEASLEPPLSIFFLCAQLAPRQVLVIHFWGNLEEGAHPVSKQ
jgi:hypothetical protein